MDVSFKMIDSETCLSGKSPSADLAFVLEMIRKLHDLFLRDLDDSPEANDLRDRMDLPWRRLTREEKVVACKLSEDLYIEARKCAASSE